MLRMVTSVCCCKFQTVPLVIYSSSLGYLIPWDHGVLPREAPWESIMNRVFLASLVATCVIAMLVFGPSFAQTLLSAKVLLIGMFLSFIGLVVAERCSYMSKNHRVSRRR